MENTFTIPIIPGNETERLKALRRYELIGTSAEKSFRRIAEMIAVTFQAKMAMITLVDEETVHFESSVGLDFSVAPRGISFCSLTILSPDVNVVENALHNDIVCKNPTVTGSFGLRFYAGAPLITQDGFAIGSVCLVDTKPRTFDQRNRQLLQGMAAVVMEQVELRLITLEETHKQIKANEELLISNNQLARSEKRFQQLLDTMAEGVAITDATGRLTYVNAMAERILGVKAEEVRKRSYDDKSWRNLRVNGTELPFDEHPMSIVVATRQPVYDYEISIQPPGGERLFIAINAAPLLDEAGNLTGGVATFMDVTNRRKELQRKDEFISIASHELKTPVTSLKASLQLLHRMKDEPDNAVRSQMVDQANKSLNKLSSLIADLLDSSRISEGQLKLHKSEFLVSKLIGDCCTHIRNGGKYFIDVTGDQELKIVADEHKIDQVMVNLINNAVKYAPESKTIFVNFRKTGDFVRIEVEDKGAGIPPEKLPHLFERYYRVHSTGVLGSGLGLGLYISAEIIRKHGGKIGVDSRKGEGCSFWFTLPTGVK